MIDGVATSSYATLASSGRKLNFCFWHFCDIRALRCPVRGSLGSGHLAHRRFLAAEASPRRRATGNPSLKVLYTTGEIVSDRMKVLYVDGAKMLPKPYTDVELEDAILATLRGP